MYKKIKNHIITCYVGQWRLKKGAGGWRQWRLIPIVKESHRWDFFPSGLMLTVKFRRTSDLLEKRHDIYIYIIYIHMYIYYIYICVYIYIHYMKPPFVPSQMLPLCFCWVLWLPYSWTLAGDDLYGTAWTHQRYVRDVAFGNEGWVKKLEDRDRSYIHIMPIIWASNLIIAHDIPTLTYIHSASIILYMVLGDGVIHYRSLEHFRWLRLKIGYDP